MFYHPGEVEMKKSLLALLLSPAISLMLPGTSEAITPFKKAFDQKYVKPSDNADFKKAYKKMSCNVCHVKGKKRDWVNHYGWELAKLIPGNAKQRQDAAKEISRDELKVEDAKLVKELEVVFDKVAKLASPSGVVYGEMFRTHQFPTAEGAKSLTEESEGTESPAE